MTDPYDADDLPEHILFQSPAEIPTELRMSMAGLLPGNDEWEDDLLAAQPELVAEWVTAFDTEGDSAAIAVIEAGKAQIRRLVPDMDDSDRSLLMLGLVVSQAWLYTNMNSIMEDLGLPGMPPILESVLIAQEIRITTLCSLLGSMGDDVDMGWAEDLMDPPEEDMTP